MKKEDLKTVDINALEWFDRVNGNSYFAGTITLNYGMNDAEVIPMTFQYGYGDCYKQPARDLMREMGVLADNEPLYYLKDKNIIVRSSIHRNCKKRELMNF